MRMKYGLIAVCLFLCIGIVHAFEKDEHTAGLWNMDEGEGDVLKDESDSGIDFNLSKRGDFSRINTPKWVVTPQGRGILLREEDGRQFGSRVIKLDNQLTFEAIIKPVKSEKGMGLYQAMTFKQNGYRVIVSKDLRVVFLLNGKGYEIGVNSKESLKSGEWAHIACTYDGKTAKIYINGKFDNEKELEGYTLGGPTYAILGYTGGTPYFNGIIEGIRISDVVLNDFGVK